MLQSSRRFLLNHTLRTPRSALHGARMSNIPLGNRPTGISNRTSVHFPLVVAGLCAMFGTMLPGCGKPEEVVSYRQSKPDVVWESNHSDEHADRGTSGTGAPQAGPARMLGAIIQRPEASWFFKLQGSPGEVADLEKEVDAFFAEVTFSKTGDIEWTLPDEWRERPGNMARYATLLVGEEGLPMSVTRLPRQPVLANVNRWRGLLGVGPLAGEADFTAANGITTIELPGGETLVRVDVTGVAKPGGMAPFANAPFMQGAAGGGGRPDPHAGIDPSRIRAGRESSNERLQFEAPEEWAEKPGSSRRATYVVKDGDDEAEIAVLEFGKPTDDSVRGIVNVWLGKVGGTTLPPGSELGDVIEEMTVDGTTVEIVDLSEEGDDPARKAITGAIIRGDGRTWTVRLEGPRGLVERERERFDEFLKTIKVSTEENAGDGE